MNTLRYMLHDNNQGGGKFGRSSDDRAETCCLLLVSAAVKEDAKDSKTFTKSSLSKTKKKRKQS